MAPAPQRMTVSIAAIADQGDGVATDGARTLFVPFTVPGDRVDVIPTSSGHARVSAWQERGPRRLGPVRRGRGAKENGLGFSSGSRHDVHAVVHAVDEVDVGAAPGLPHEAVALGEAEARVAREIALAEVRLDLGDAAAQDRSIREAPAERSTEKVAGHLGGRAAKERRP